MKLSKCLLLMALSLSAVGHAQTSQKYYFGEGQSAPQSGRATSHNRHHTKHHSPHKNQYSHP
ncbi:hypothetical protein [Paraburkholderia hospita]|jgi:hypothetical protein|uniref:Uncharacterized protein n=1 Tax=Paraburkholderia hospita TaxID=169430 RepID=A0AAN1JBL9_9BURK|nr:hypothetical protein [Paraburkholderia hospita]SKC84650.1 hypothetical protein SAMN05445504_4105 [Burkholderia sp. CF099]SOE85984.1 hypothetical protein SAMN05446935_6472 [Burkholderia sp. YR290]AUT70827.1 hypothetical protein C2L64_20960 [Paraburkholderia hospita]EIM93654.1 hypothetical protein WQE_48658 [Paraburkholderia hospita]SEI26955.1 hypothetical protein SAMN05192544_107925 [Paraburkholderia hospita]